MSFGESCCLPAAPLDRVPSVVRSSSRSSTATSMRSPRIPGDEAQRPREPCVHFAENADLRLGDLGLDPRLEPLARGAVPEGVFDRIDARLEPERRREPELAVVEVPRRAHVGADRRAVVVLLDGVAAHGIVRVKREVREQRESIADPVQERRELTVAIGRRIAERCLMALGRAALARVDRAEMVDARFAVRLRRRAPGLALAAHGSRRDLARAVPRRAVRHPRERQLRVVPEVVRRAPEQIEAPEFLGIHEGTVAAATSPATTERQVSPSTGEATMSPRSIPYCPSVYRRGSPETPRRARLTAPAVAKSPNSA